MDLSREAIGSVDNVAPTIQQTRHRLIRESKRIKKLIVVTHGSIAMVLWDIYQVDDDTITGAVTLEKLTDALMPLKPLFVLDQPEIHLGACSVAGRCGRFSVEKMGDRLLPMGGIIEGNKVWGLAGGGYLGSLNRYGVRRIPPEALFTLSFPVTGEGGQLLGYVVSFKITLPLQHMLHNHINDEYNPWPDDNAFKYRHVVTNPQDR